MFIKKGLFILFILIQQMHTKSLQIIGGGLANRGIEGIGLTLFKVLNDKFDINYTFTTVSELNDLDLDLKEKLFLANKTQKKEYDFALYTDILATIDSSGKINSNIKYISSAKKKIVLSMLECSKIPKFWVDTLNTKFDYVIVPTQWVKDVYTRCGVTCPIEVIPLPIEKKNSLKKKKDLDQPFIFGTAGGLGEDKNLHKVIEAFIKNFKNDKQIKLIVKISGYQESNISLASKIINISKQTNNIELIWGFIPKDNLYDLLMSLDCFILASKGEGYSIIPRDALSFGIPTILSYNSAHMELCDLGLAIPLKSNNKCLSDYRCFGDFKSYKYDCNIDDIAKLMKNVYENYDYFYNLTQENISLMSQYFEDNIREMYLDFLNKISD